MTDVDQKMSWALQACLLAKIRLTPARRKILFFLAAQRIPVNLDVVTQAEGIQGTCNTSTIYRNLMLLSEREVVRQVNITNKIRYFILNAPRENGHFLVCQTCATISALPLAESVITLEREVASAHSYARLHHELLFFGLCPTCQTKRTLVAFSKTAVSTTETTSPLSRPVQSAVK